MSSNRQTGSGAPKGVNSGSGGQPAGGPRDMFEDAANARRLDNTESLPTQQTTYHIVRPIPLQASAATSVDFYQTSNGITKTGRKQHRMEYHPIQQQGNGVGGGRVFDVTLDNGTAPPANNNIVVFGETDESEDFYIFDNARNGVGGGESLPTKSSTTENINKFVGLKDIYGNNDLWKALLGEFIGTFFLVLIGCGSCISGWNPGYKPTMVQIALAFGITIATFAQAIGHISGCHLNPAVTLGLIIYGKCSLLKGAFYVLTQCVAAICGSAVLQALTPVELRGNLGSTLISYKLGAVHGFVLEALITFVLVITVCAFCDELRSDTKGSAPLAIGLSVTVCHLMAIQYTGSSMNPARSLGPAVIHGDFTNHWVYWAGPLLGAVIAGFLYKSVFEAQPKDKDS